MQLSSLYHIPHAGLLESVSNLTVTPVNSTTVLISWSPPFTLDGVPILGYNVTITNTTSGENETMSVEGDTTILYYSIDHLKSIFTITVVPINVVGEGDDASIQSELRILYCNCRFLCIVGVHCTQV